MEGAEDGCCVEWTWNRGGPWKLGPWVAKGASCIGRMVEGAEDGCHVDWSQVDDWWAQRDDNGCAEGWLDGCELAKESLWLRRYYGTGQRVR